MTKQCYLGQGLIAFKPTELRGARTNDIASLTSQDENRI